MSYVVSDFAHAQNLYTTFHQLKVDCVQRGHLQLDDAYYLSEDVDYRYWLTSDTTSFKEHKSQVTG